MELAVAALAADNYGCGHYRIINPIKTLASLGVKAALFDTVNVGAFAEYNVIFAQRQVTPEVKQSLAQLALRGKLVVTEIDDILENTHPSNPAYAYYHNGTPDLANYLQILRSSHGITCSTEELAAHYKGQNPNSVVVPNLIDYNLREWPGYARNPDGKVRVGWTGSTSHNVDLDMVGPVIKVLMDKYSHLIYVHYSNKEMLTNWAAKWDIDLDRCEYIAPVEFDVYPTNLNKFDIGIAPLSLESFTGKFNKCRSYLKPMEYNAVGIPYVVTNQASYIRYQQKGGQGFIVGNSDEWIERLSELIEDRNLRETMGAAGLLHVREKHSLKDNIVKYIDAWNYIGTHLHDVAPEIVTTKVGRNDPCPCGCGRKAKKCPTYGAWGI